MNFDWNVIWTHRGALWDGALMTVGLTVLTMLLAVPGGILLALMRLSSNKLLSSASLAFVEFFRNLPLILVIYWAFYVMPIAFDVQFSALTTALVALVLNVSAYNAETFRAGINSIRKGQMEAALAMGMSRRQAMFKVVIPQAARRILPVLASTWISLFKDTSLVSVIAVSELAYTSMQIRAQTFRVLEMLTAMAALYWLWAIRRQNSWTGSTKNTESRNDISYPAKHRHRRRAGTAQGGRTAARAGL
jgi:His/Glu/Gln/Arg/opine family amino acid ABC transporter permease subunit